MEEHQVRESRVFFTTVMNNSRNSVGIKSWNTREKVCPYLALNAISYCEEVPQIFEEIKGCDDESEWYEAVEEELASLVTNETWNLGDIPKGQKMIKSKWVFTIKKNDDGEIDRYEARLVVKGCSQRTGMDYFETYALGAKLATSRTVLCVVNAKQYFAHQLDVKKCIFKRRIKRIDL